MVDVGRVTFFVGWVIKDLSGNLLDINPGRQDDCYSMDLVNQRPNFSLEDKNQNDHIPSRLVFSTLKNGQSGGHERV